MLRKVMIVALIGCLNYMENLSQGVCSFLLSGMAFGGAFYFFSKENKSLGLILLVLGGLILRVYTSCDWYLHEWDERYHALVAKNMLYNPWVPMLYANPILPFDSSSWTSNHIWLHKLPVPLWCMALSINLLGLNELALRLPSILLSSLAILLCYDIGKRLFSSSIGFTAAFLCAVNGLIIELAAGRVATDHIDVFFMAFVLASVWVIVVFVENKNSLLLIVAGMFLALAILSKWLPGLIVLVFYWLLDKDILKRKITNALILLFPSLIFVGVWQWYIHKNFPIEAAIEGRHRVEHFLHILDGQGGPFWYHFLRATAVVHEFVWVAVIGLFFLAVKSGNRKVYALVVLSLVPYVFFSFAATKMQAYLLFVAPALFILIALFYEHYIKNISYSKTLKWIAIILFWVLPLRYCIERTKFFSQRERNPGWVAKLKQLNNEPPNTVVFNEPRYIEAMFYSNVTAYPYIPDVNTLKELKNKGYNVIIK